VNETIAEDSGVATEEFCNHGLQSVVKEGNYINTRAVGSVHVKIRGQYGKYVSPNLSANSLCGPYKNKRPIWQIHKSNNPINHGPDIYHRIKIKE